MFLLLFTEVRFEQALGALFIFFRLIRTPVALLNMYDVISKGAGAYSRLEAFEKLAQKGNFKNTDTSNELIKCMRPSIQLDNVYISHFPEYGIWSLFDVNIRIPFGQRVAIVGSSGSGKSSILNIRPLLVGILFQLHRPRQISLPHEYCHYCHYIHYYTYTLK